MLLNRAGVVCFVLCTVIAAGNFSENDLLIENRFSFDYNKQREIEMMVAWIFVFLKYEV